VLMSTEYLEETSLPTPTSSADGSNTEHLEKDPVARRNKPPAVGWCDKSFLARFDGTNLVQWFGRKSDGGYYPHGKVMRIVRHSGDNHDSG